MFLRQLLAISLIFSCFAVSTDAQVNVAAPGESGLGVGAAAAFTADGAAIGMQFGGTANGLVDLGLAIRRETPEGGNSYWVKGIALDVVPLRTRDHGVRWSLGGTFSYEFTNVTYTTFSWDGYAGYTSTASRSIEVLSVGGLLFADVDVSPKTYLQIAGQIALSDYSGSSKSVTFYTVGAGFVTKQGDRGKVGFLASATIPSEGEYWTFGVQINLFWAQRRNRLE